MPIGPLRRSTATSQKTDTWPRWTITTYNNQQDNNAIAERRATYLFVDCNFDQADFPKNLGCNIERHRELSFIDDIQGLIAPGFYGKPEIAPDRSGFREAYLSSVILKTRKFLRGIRSSFCGHSTLICIVYKTDFL
jgi:hypothetical protein